MNNKLSFLAHFFWPNSPVANVLSREPKEKDRQEYSLPTFFPHIYLFVILTLNNQFHTGIF